MPPRARAQIPLISLTAYLRARLKNDALGVSPRHGPGMGQHRARLAAPLPPASRQRAARPCASIRALHRAATHRHAAAAPSLTPQHLTARARAATRLTAPRADLAPPHQNAIFWIAFCILGQPLCILLYAHGGHRARGARLRGAAARVPPQRHIPPPRFRLAADRRAARPVPAHLPPRRCSRAAAPQ